jgi:hypothetical protein
MSARQKSSLAQLLAKRGATASGGTEASETTPFFDRVIANSTGTESFEALLSKITGPIDPATLPEFPTTECLTAEQVSGIAKIEPNEETHFATCPWCKSMMAAAQPTNQEFEEILRKAKNATEARRHREVAAY